MIAFRPVPLFAALVAAGTVTFAANRASADCTTDAECGKGLTCQVVGSSECSNIACPANTQCPQLPPCVPTPIKACAPAPCNVDSDCGDGMVCYTNSSTTCTTAPAPSCPPNTKCDPAPTPDPSCTITTEKLCVPKYLLPCTTAADCGAGFTCVPDQSGCGCASSGGVGFADAGIAVPGNSGSEPAPSSSGGTPAPDAAPSGTGTPLPSGCSCPPATTNRCEAQIIDCTANSQCPTGWACSEVATGGSACGAPVLPDGGIGMTVCEPTPPPSRQCTPPYYDLVTNGHGGVTLGSGVPPQGEATSGAAGSSNNGPGAGSAPKSAAAPSASSGDTGGCQVGRAPANAGASLLAFFGLVGLSRRRRSRVR